MTKEEAKKEIAKLVKKFNDNISYYQRNDYKETPTRRDFIDPFFFALGWDMDNKEGLSEPFREVVHEYSLETKNSTEAPDYSFRDADGNNLFFVEAKKPSVDLAKNIFPAYQTRNYAWNARLKISILTDFEELSIYNTTTLPKLTDKPHIARIKYIPFTDYLKEFDFIWDNLAKENVLNGSINKLLKLQINGHTETVDKIFVKSLDEWREILAESIAKNNLNLNEEEVNFCVQHFIDRIIFLRIAEDRKVEDKDNLRNCISKGNYYKNFYEYFLIADKKYNSGIFDFAKDILAERLKIDNDTIKTVITELYESPYLFNIIPVEILGIAYEQFLGKIIRLTKSHNAKIELKPEVRKAGGVYY
ncbi:MAG: methyltransferase, partial [Bacteroidota bacterium]